MKLTISPQVRYTSIGLITANNQIISCLFLGLSGNFVIVWQSMLYRLSRVNIVLLL